MLKGGDAMDKERGQIKFIETDDGYRIEIKGKDIKDMMSCCGWPMFGAGRAIRVECCEPEAEKK
jgi:hypothetical protein